MRCATRIPHVGSKTLRSSISLCHSPPYFLAQNLSLNWKLTVPLAYLTNSYPASSGDLSVSVSQNRGYRHAATTVLFCLLCGIQTLVLIRAFFSPNHPLSPHSLPGMPNSLSWLMC